MLQIADDGGVEGLLSSLSESFASAYQTLTEEGQ